MKAQRAAIELRKQARAEATALKKKGLERKRLTRELLAIRKGTPKPKKQKPKSFQSRMRELQAPKSKITGVGRNGRKIRTPARFRGN